MRAKLLFACLAVGGFVNAAAPVKAYAQMTPAAEAEMAKYAVNVGKDYWVSSALLLCTGPARYDCNFIFPRTHLKIEGVVLNQSPDNRPIFDPVYRVTLDDGRVGYFTGCRFLTSPTSTRLWQPRNANAAAIRMSA